MSMKRSRAGYTGVTVLLALLMALPPAAALARDSYRLPPGHRLTAPGGTFHAYSLAEFKLLLKMDVDLEAFSKQIPKYIKLQEDSAKLISNFNKQVELKDVSIKLLQDDRLRLTQKWTEENRLRHLAENKPSWTTWFAWGAAGLMAVVAAVLAGVLVAKD